MSKTSNVPPIFTRGELAKILKCAPLTIANREKSKKYPSPDRDLNGYRIYSLNDVFNLQLITFNKLDPRPVVSIMYDKGYRDPKEIGKMVDEVLSRKRGE